jgi:hypothetical protein
MFNLSMRDCAVHGIQSYDEALAFYESCPTSRGTSPGDERKIRGKERSAMGVRVKQDKVMFRYHRTDVVVWHKDSAVRINTWSSSSTCTFANAFLPGRMWLTRSGSVLQKGDQMYPVVRWIEVAADGEVTHAYPNTHFYRDYYAREDTGPLVKATRYSEYRAWYAIMRPLLTDGIRTQPLRSEDVRELLADEAGWHTLLTNKYGTPDNVRRTLYSLWLHEGSLRMRQRREAWLPVHGTTTNWSVATA